MPDTKRIRNRFNMNKYLAMRFSSKNILGKREHQIRRNTQFSPSNLDKRMTILFHVYVHLLCFFFPLSLGSVIFLKLGYISGLINSFQHLFFVRSVQKNSVISFTFFNFYVTFIIPLKKDRSHLPTTFKQNSILY